MNSQSAGVLGVQTPTYRNVPDAVSSAGQEAIDLAASAGLILDEWQENVLLDSMGERRNGNWAAQQVGLIVPRQNGKGTVLEARVLAGLFLLNEQLIIWSAHEFKTAKEAFLRVKGLIESNPHLDSKVRQIPVGAGNEGVEMRSGQRLRFLARSGGSGRGFSGDTIILDEAYALTDENMAAILPVLSAKPNPQLWYTSSAPLVKSNVLRRLCKTGRAGESSKLAYFEWCAPPDAASDDVEAWARSNPGLGIRLSEEYTQTELDTLDDEDFRRERMGIWLEDAFETVLDLQKWRELADAGSMFEGAPVFAFDVAPDRSSAAVAVAGHRSDGLWHVETIDHRPGAAWVVDYLVERAGRHEPAAILVDERSPAASLLPDLADRGLKVSSEPRRGTENIIVTTSSSDLARACGAFYDAVMDTKTVRHLGQASLNQAVEGAATRALGDAWAWSRKESESDITPLVAATLALYGGSLYAAMQPVVPWISYG